MENLIDIASLPELFNEVQMKEVFADGKTFTDCVPKFSLQEIEQNYLIEKAQNGFNLKAFVLANFEPPKVYVPSYQSNTQKTAQEHIEELWDVLLRKPDTEKSSLVPLPYPYIVPGGRFGEIYYWDSYFTMLGLQVSGRVDIIQNMVDNFAFLIKQIGYIPNGNRTYFIGRSQPPFFSLMVNLLATEKGDEVLLTYLPQLQKEYDFWMLGETELSSENSAINRVVQLADGSILNRYWDFNETPRPESHREDVELAQHTKTSASTLYRHLRAAAESGWDFSSRWFTDPQRFESIHTTDIIPVDLNCLLYHLEQTLAKAYQLDNNMLSVSFEQKAQKRKEAILHYCWSASQQFFVDYDFVAQQQTSALSLAAAYPLFFNIANNTQAAAVAEILENKFLKIGGLITTTETTGQQWDAPNGWAPLHWMSYQGLVNYQFDDLANEIKKRWINVNLKVYEKTGKMTEKYDVCNENLEASGGEYPNQEGFGWTNGVLMKFLSI